MELDVWTHGDGPLGEVLVGGQRFGEIRDDLAGGRDGHQGIEYRASIEEPRPVKAPCGGVEPLLLGTDTDGQVAATSGLGPGEAISTGSVGGDRPGLRGHKHVGERGSPDGAGSG